MKKVINSALIAAGGSGTRMGGNIPKQFMTLNGIPIIIYTLMQFERCRFINEIVVSARGCDTELIWTLARRYGISKLSCIAEGGAARCESVLNGLKKVNGEYVFIHDAARPFVTQKQIREVVSAVHRFGAASLGIPVKDTVKQVDKNKLITKTVRRDDKCLIQTPQGFKTDEILSAHIYARDNGIEATDDCAAAELLNIPIRVIEGSSQNFKITTPDDMFLAEAIVKRRGAERRKGNASRIGI